MFFIPSMTPAALHTVFDILAWLAAGAAAWAVSRVPGVTFTATTKSLSYVAAVLFGAGVGAYIFGTANTILSGLFEPARSVEGALAGGIFAVEIYKRIAGIRERTGARFALPLAVGIAVGRIGCYFGGLEDFTYGTPTALPWGHDFGDGLPRHPVQLYESASMAAFALFYIICLWRRNRYVIDNGFPLAIGFYAMQRFVWEFLKPYTPVIGPLTLFHLLSLALFVYAVAMLMTFPSPKAHRSTSKNPAS